MGGKNLAENQLTVKNSTLNVCSNHFILGRLSKLYKTWDPGLAPSINLGYSTHNGNTSGIERFSKTERRREFQMNQRNSKQK